MPTAGEFIAFVCVLVVTGFVIWGLKRLEGRSDDEDTGGHGD